APKSNFLATFFPLPPSSSSKPPHLLFKSDPTLLSPSFPPLLGRFCIGVGLGSILNHRCSNTSLQLTRFLGSSFNMPRSTSTPSGPTLPNVERKNASPCSGIGPVCPFG